jgi:hypothetical protein
LAFTTRQENLSPVLGTIIGFPLKVDGLLKLTFVLMLNRWELKKDDVNSSQWKRWRSVGET